MSFGDGIIRPHNVQIQAAGRPPSISQSVTRLACNFWLSAEVSMFDDDFKDFDLRFEKTRKLAIGGMIVSAVVSLGILGFIGWVIVKLLSHFGVM